MNFLDQPDEIIVEQLSYLSIETLMAISVTCKRLASLTAKNSYLWRLKLKQDYGVFDSETPREDYLYIYDLYARIYRSYLMEWSL